MIRYHLYTNDKCGQCFLDWDGLASGNQCQIICHIIAIFTYMRWCHSGARSRALYVYGCINLNNHNMKVISNNPLCYFYICLNPSKTLVTTYLKFWKAVNNSPTYKVYFFRKVQHLYLTLQGCTIKPWKMIPFQALSRVVE